MRILLGPQCIVMLILAALPSFASLDTAVIDVTQPPYNAVGDGVTDNTKAFQDALYQAGEGTQGGKVFVPRGNYLISGTLRFRPNVTLEGVWDFAPNSPQFWYPEQAAQPLAGSVLLATSGEGDADGEPFITLHYNCAIKGLTIFYPNQVKENPPKPYPWTVAVTEGGADHCTIINVLMVNPYQAVNFGRAGSGRHFIQNLYAYALYKGLFIDQCYDIGRVENVHFWPFWGYTGDDDPLGRFVSENATAFIIGRTDWEYMVNCFAIFYKIGFHFIKTEAGSPNVLLTQCGADIGPYAVLAEDVQGHAGVSFVNSQLFGRVTVNATNTGPLRFTNCGFFGATRENPFQEPIHFDIAGTGHVSLSNCHFITLDPLNRMQIGVRAAGGGLSIVNSYFMDPGRTHVQLEPGLRTAVIFGNTFRGEARIVNNSRANAQIGFNVDEKPIEEDGAVVIDDSADDGAFETEGIWRVGQGGGDYLGFLHWAYKGDASAKAWWRPRLPESGRYEVLIWYGGDPDNNHATDAPFIVKHRDGETEHRINLRERIAEWVSLGVYAFDKDGESYVMTHNAANDNVVADAVKFVRSGE